MSLKSAARRLTGAIVTAAGLGLWLWVRGCCRKSLYCLATISWQVCHVGIVPTPDAKRSPAGPKNETVRAATALPTGLGLPRIISPFAASSGWPRLQSERFCSDRGRIRGHCTSKWGGWDRGLALLETALCPHPITFIPNSAFSVPPHAFVAGYEWRWRVLSSRGLAQL